MAIVSIIILILLGPPFLFTVIGRTIGKNRKRMAKVFYALAIFYIVFLVVVVIIFIGSCGGF